MKLIKCYIENFGGLSEYKLDFNEGITVINEHNGFGKTTLAEFIKAMFYGLPRNNKDPLKSARTRYKPWQGGKYGGYLDFSMDGTTYRISRYFGDSQKQDKFNLYEGESLKPSTRFSEKIGDELFELDAESFERSTYMPQTHSPGSLTSSSIQSKLSDLVDDTNDINNYDKAVELLKKKRSSYMLFKGNGGSIASASEKISKLQAEIDASAELPDALLTERQNNFAFKNEKILTTKKRDEIREEIRISSEALATLTIKNHYSQLLAERDNYAAELNELREKLPSPLPDISEIDALMPAFDGLAALKTSIPDPLEAKEAKAAVSKHREKFKNRLPDDDEIKTAELKNGERIALMSSAVNLRLSSQEQNQLDELSSFFGNSVPDEKELIVCRDNILKLQELKNMAASREIPPEETRRLKELSEFFRPGLINPEDIENKQKEVSEISRLQQENVRISSMHRISEPEEPLKPKNAGFAVLTAVGIFAAILGLVLLTGRNYLTGGISLAAAAVLVLSAVLLHFRQMINLISVQKPAGPVLGEYEKELLYTNESKIRELEAGLDSFCSRYIADSRTYAEKLSEINAKLSLYLPLKKRADEAEEIINSLQRDMEDLIKTIKAYLYPYFGATENFADCFSELVSKLRDYKMLRCKEQDFKAELLEVKDRYDILEKEIYEFLREYYPENDNSAFGLCLSNLPRDKSEYLQAIKRLEQIEAAEEKRQKEKSFYLNMLCKFNENFGLQLKEDMRSELLSLRDSIRRSHEAEKALTAKDAEIKEFYLSNSECINAPEPEEIRDTDSLKAEESSLSEKIQKLDEEILRGECRIRELDREVNEIPVKQDKLQELISRRNEDIRSCNLLDMTLVFMAQAKEDLNNSYLGPIKKSFSHYLELLTGENQDNVILDAELNIRLERSGEARELPYFSVGQADILMLCMRLALLDALFKRNKPFIILDDPFVNLDNERTEEALKLLKVLEKEHQIIYLVCNSSRI